MANQQAATPPPSSPRAPKIQQQSWDDCGSPPIDLYDPNNTRDSPPPLSPLALGFMPLPPPRSPKGTRKLPTLHDPAGNGSPGPKRIVRKLDSTHSEPAASGDYYSPTAPATCGGGVVGSGGSKRIQTNHTGSLGEARSPFLKSPNNNSSRSFVFDEAIAPKYEKSKSPVCFYCGEFDERLIIQSQSLTTLDTFPSLVLSERARRNGL